MIEFSVLNGGVGKRGCLSRVTCSGRQGKGIPQVVRRAERIRMETLGLHADNRSEPFYLKTGFGVARVAVGRIGSLSASSGIFPSSEWRKATIGSTSSSFNCCPS